MRNENILRELSLNYIEDGMLADIEASELHNKINERFELAQAEFESILNEEQKKYFDFTLSNVAMELNAEETSIAYMAGFREAFKFFTGLQAKRG